MLKLLSALVLFSSFVFPQSSDSLLIQNNLSGFDSTSVSITDSLASDTTKVKETIVKADTLIPIQGQPLSDVSNIISRNTFLFENYRYTGDLLRSFNLNFIKDLGFIGYPNESFIYGVGNGGVSYMLDGVLWNNRFTNSLDLNLVQSEDIDSIENVPSPRGFLYGPYNNPVTVNFITRDFIVPVPYARIKYYQGPNAEAMIDGRFSALLAKRWNLSFEVTNRSIDSTYTNTEFSFWNVNAKLKYFLSNSVNVTGWYYFVSDKQGLNGGVNIDSVNSIPPSYNIDMYSLEAPVVYPNQKLDVLQNNFGLRTLAKPFENSKLDFSIYYRYNQDEKTNSLDDINVSLDLDEKVLGGNLNYFQRISLVSFQLFSSYEYNYYKDNRKKYRDGITLTEYNKYIETNIFNIGGLFTLYLLNDAFQASIFYKYDGITTVNYNTSRSGQGVDFKYQLQHNLMFYLGISTYENYNYQDAGSFEAGAMFNYSNLIIDFKYFSNDYNLFKPQLYYGIISPGIKHPTGNVKGVGLQLNYKYWLLLLETNTSYYINNNTKEVDQILVDDLSLNLPDWQFIGGLYVNSLFFDDNLDLKAGFKFYYTGKINSFDYTNLGTIPVNPSNKLDFTLAGEIKKVAIFYFIWENLYYNQYYITPYYPMPDGNIRFGIAWELFN
jgi:hypothetical protein